MLERLSRPSKLCQHSASLLTERQQSGTVLFVKRLNAPSSCRDASTGLISIEAPLVDHPGWSVAADIDDSGSSAQIISVSIRRQDHPAVGNRLSGVHPEGAVTAQLLRSVPLSELMALANVHLRYWAPGKRLPDPHRLQERSPEYYATWAALYVQALANNPRRALSDLAEAHGMERTVMRDLINRCRAKGYLTRGPKGRAGGQLTEQALDALKGSKR